MNLVVIYGPPASGKMTTASNLSEITGYRVFHNHLAIDLVNSIAPDGKLKEYTEFLFRIIYDTVKFAWEKGQAGLIMTIAYTGSDGQKNLLKNLKTLVESNGGRICFVKLFCDIEELKKRVVNPTRDYYGKLMSAEELEKWMSETNYLGNVDFAETFEVDNTKRDAWTVAALIRSHFNL